jgi:hypothetical protein
MERSLQRVRSDVSWMSIWREKNWEQEAKMVDYVLGLNEVSFMGLDFYVLFLVGFVVCDGDQNCL